MHPQNSKPLLPRKGGGKSKSTLERTPFTTSRLLEFFSEKELNMQIGQPQHLWPVALVKELVDNALDACESAGVSPCIRIVIEPNAVSIEDNGPGLPREVLERSLDYSVRISDKSHYVSPTRGQLGNALKCVWAAPFVADGTAGRVEVVTRCERHVIDVTLNRIEETPRLGHQVFADCIVKNGTLLRLHWPEIAAIS
jgi:DNA topoisomerase VI subunit B